MAVMERAKTKRVLTGAQAELTPHSSSKCTGKALSISILAAG